MTPLLLSVPVLLSLPASAGEFMDVWVTTAFEDGNVLAGPEADSPAMNFVERGKQTFFENYESRFTDDISQSYLVLYRKDDGFHPNVFTEAAFVLRFQPYTDPNDTKPDVSIKDDGSYVRIGYKFGGVEDHNLSLTGYAVDANRFRLGYSYDLTWGGSNIFAFDPRAAPGVRAQYQNGRFYAFVGAKTALGDFLRDKSEGGDGLIHEEAYFGALAGVGGEIGDHVRLESGFGSFQQGQLTNVEDASSPLYHAPINAIGGSAQAAFRTTDKIDYIVSNELKLYRNAPDFVKDTYISHRQVDGVGLLVQAEVNVLSHNLLDFDTVDSTVVETAMSGDVQALLAIDTTEIGADVVYKDLPYIFFNIPGSTSGASIPGNWEITPQVYVRGRVAHWFPKAHLTPSLGVGYMQPATYRAGNGAYFVQYDERTKQNVPDGQAPAALLSTVAGLQADISKSVVVVGEVLYTLDNNLSDFVEDPDGGADGVNVLAPSNERNALGFNLMMRARF